MTSPEESTGAAKAWPARALRVSAGVIVASLLALSAAAWVATARSTGMIPSVAFRADGSMMAEAMGPALFIATWVVMMVAMMFPSVGPMVIAHRRLSRRREQPAYTTVVFVAGYLLVWSVIGIGAYLVHLGIVDIVPTLSTRVAALIAGAVLAGAGVYQLSRYKTVCLRHCRGPLEFVLHFRPGSSGALRMGTSHGLYCLGCCWGLMIVLFVLGLMNLAWMAAIAVVIFIEKVSSFGEAVAKGVGIGLIVVGALVAVVPVLTGAGLA